MATLMFNQSLEICTEENKGIWRVVSPASSKSDFNVLVFIPENIAQWKKKREEKQPKLRWLWITPSECEDLINNELCSLVEIHPHPQLRKAISELPEKQRELREKRESVVKRLINPMELTACLKNKGSIYLLVKEAIKRCGVSKKHVYDQFTRLCWYGFELGSLNPQFYNCGAPGVARPWIETRVKVGPKPLPVKLSHIPFDPQIGMTEETTRRVVKFFKSNRDPKKSQAQLHRDLVKKYYITSYQLDADGRRPIYPPKGSYPNLRQVS